MLYPFIHTIAMSISGPSPIKRGIVYFWPLVVQFTSYKYILDNKLFWTAFRLTAWITIVGTAYSLLMTCLLAYPLSKKDFLPRTPITLMVVFTMFFGGGLVPEYLLYRTLHLYDTFYVYIIPGAISTWSLLILRNFFIQIPEELEESALIDGANEWKILFKIIVPISLPALATITLWYAVGKWNTFDQSLYFTSSQHLRVLQLVLRNVIVDQENIAQSLNSDILRALTSQSLKAAWIICTTVPIMVVYPFLQKHFVKGVIVGSLKG
jgi:putative aldouronate transport system permease protein